MRDCFAVSVDTVTDGVLKECVEKQDIETKDDDFKLIELLY
jgi:hypothetical protein